MQDITAAVMQQTLDLYEMVVEGGTVSFPFESNQLEILGTPDEYFSALLNGFNNAQSRIIISTLYLGTGELEQRLVDSIVENPNCPQVTVLADATRSTRSLKATHYHAGAQAHDFLETSPVPAAKSPLFLLQRIAQLDNARVALYHSHRLRGWLRRILPERFNETVGLQHMKIYIFDDNVIIGGANLSEEYFKNRQDRAWLFKGVPDLVDFYSGLIDTVASLSYQVNPQGALKSASEETDPVHADAAAYCDLFRSRVEAYLSSAVSRRQTQSPVSATLPHSVVSPVVQMGAYGIRQESSLVQRLLRALTDSTDAGLESVALTSGYFCPTHELEAALIELGQRPLNPPKIDVLCAAPEANSFFKSKGLSGNIPAAYREMLISFVKRASRATSLRVQEYLRPGWTFHAKGLWLETGATSLCLVGSSNYGYRSRDLDLETQLVVVSRDAEVRRHMAAERQRLWDPQHLRPVSEEALSVPVEPRFKWYARWMLPMLRRIM